MKKSYKTFLQAILILFVILYSKSQITYNIYPETIENIDNIFNNDNPNAALFESKFPEIPSGPTQIIHIEKQGISFTANSQFQGELVTDNVTYDPVSTIALGYAQTQLTELNQLYSFTVRSDNANGRIKIRFDYIHGANTAYTYQATYRIFNFGAGGDIYFRCWDGTNYTMDLTGGNSYNVPGAAMYTLNFTVQQNPGAATTDAKVTFMGNIRNCTFRTAPNFIDFVVGVAGGSPNSVGIGPYWVIINNGGSGTFTNTGAINCGAGVGCMKGYTCIGTSCVLCYDSCLTCTVQRGTAGDSSGCTSCRSHAIEWKGVPAGGVCNMEYVDLNQFNNVVIPIVPIRTERACISNWVYIHDMASMQAKDSVVNIALTDFLVMSIAPTSANNILINCNFDEKTNPNLKTQTTVTGMGGFTTGNNRTVNILNVGGRWFYSRCCMSRYHNSVYALGKYGTNNYLSQAALAMRNIWDVVQTDVHFRSIYRTGDLIQVQINNASNANSKFYIKNLHIFRDYIEPDVHLQYWNLTNETSPANFPFMHFALDFNQLIYNTVTGYEVNYHIYQQYGSRVTTLFQIVPTNPTGINLFPPDNFKRLETHNTFDRAYSTTKDLQNTTALVIGPNQFHVFNDNQAFSCTVGNYLNLLPSPNVSRFTCNADCPINGANRYTVNPLMSSQKGECGSICQLNAVCPNLNAQLGNIKGTFDCLPGAFPAFYSCVLNPPPREYSLFFGSYYPSQNLVLNNFPTDAVNRMDSYIIEIWWMRDNMVANNLKHLAPGPDFKNYIFYSNTLRLFQNGSNQRYYVETPFTAATAANVDVNVLINPAEWNKLIFNVRYVQPTYTFEFIVRNNSATLTAVGNTNVVNQYLQFIVFCHRDPASCSGIDIYWSLGYYKNLRVWDGDMASPWVIYQYDQ